MFRFSILKERIVIRFSVALFAIILIATWFYDFHTREIILMPIFAVLASVLGLSGGVILLIALVYYISFYFREDGKQYMSRVLEIRPELSPQVLEWEQEILSLGFEPFAIREGYNPAKGTILNQVLYYRDESKTLVVSLVLNPKMPFVIFTCKYADGFEQETLYNYKNWTNLDSAEAFWVAVKGSISLAYDYHQYQRERFSASHGELIRAEQIEDYLAKPEQQKKQLRAYYLNNIRHYLEHLSFYAAFFIAGLVSLQVYEIYGTLGGLAALLSIGFLPMALYEFDETINRTKPIDFQKKRKIAE